MKECFLIEFCKRKIKEIIVVIIISEEKYFKEFMIIMKVMKLFKVWENVDDVFLVINLIVLEVGMVFFFD